MTCFPSIRVKAQNFAPITQPSLNLEMKRDFCLWLEEASYNVGKQNISFLWGNK
ncbi:hypothetical protein RintRC_5915 [Richelia intracellularis]|nr:hypothetical protein RintRC_5915 [Richelia intracellularis]